MKSTIVRPLITEKSLAKAAKGGYTFVTDLHARKETIAHDIHAHYNVTVTDVTTAVMHGKMRRAGKRARPEKRPDWKKAVVRLAPGQKIDAFTITQESQTPTK